MGKCGPRVPKAKKPMTFRNSGVLWPRPTPTGTSARNCGPGVGRHESGFQGKDARANCLIDGANRTPGPFSQTGRGIGATVCRYQRNWRGSTVRQNTDEIGRDDCERQAQHAEWALSPKAARELETIINGGKSSSSGPSPKASRCQQTELVHAESPGDGSNTRKVAIGGHLFEGYSSKGANDDNSGCALRWKSAAPYQ